MPHNQELASRIAEIYVQAFLPNVPSTLKAAVESGVLSAVRSGLQPFPVQDPQRELGKVAALLMKGMRGGLPVGVSLNSREAHDFLGTLISMTRVNLRDSDLELAVSRVSEAFVDASITGRLEAVLSEMIKALANDVSRGAARGQKKAVRLLERMGLEEYEALQVLDNLVNAVSLSLSMSGAEFNSILDSYLTVARAAKVAGDIPKTVERYVKEHKDQGMDEDKSWAIAWSRYCKHKKPGSPRCKQKEYFHGKGKESLHLEIMARAVAAAAMLDH